MNGEPSAVPHGAPERTAPERRLLFGGGVGAPGSARRALAATGAVAVAHAANDAYASFLHPLLPRLMESLGLSIALAATLAMTLSIAASLVQPVMGHLADRFGRRAFVVFGPVCCGVFLSLIGVAPGFALLMVVLALGGLGSAAFHPPAASMAVRISEGRGGGFRYSVFSFAGSIGYAAGPLIAVGMVAAVGLECLWLAMIPVVVLAPALWIALPSGRAERRTAAPPRARELVRLLAGPLGLIFGVSAIGAFIQRVFLTMEPIIVARSGGSEAAGAAMLSVYLAGSAVGSLLGGPLADRVDRRRLLALVSALALPAHALALGLPPDSGAAAGAAFVAGLLNMAILPPIVLMAQELVPRGAGASSGIVMGLAWATGSVGVLGTGALGDIVGARTAALASLPVLLVACALAASPALRRVARPL